jgi:uncharacterized protein (TIGR03083 family)
VTQSRNQRKNRAQSAVKLDPRHDDPFPVYDREIERLTRFLRRLDDRGWSRASHCRGWTVKDIVAHLSTDEVYNQACLDHSLGQLPWTGGLDSWNARGVKIRRGFSPLETLQEWEARQQRVRQAWEVLGLNARIQTSVGRYPLILEVWHLAREYAIHADDIEVPVPPRERREQLRWRAAFGIYAAREEGEPLDATLLEEEVELRLDGRNYRLDLETFVAYLTNRPQQLKDPKQRALVRRLLR